MEKQGAEVHLYDERCNPSTFDKICIRLNLRTFSIKKIKSFYKAIIEKYENNYFDYVIFLNSETITVDLLNVFVYTINIIERRCLNVS